MEWTLATGLSEAKTPQSQTLRGTVTKSMAVNTPLHLSPDLFLRYCLFCAWHTADIDSAFQLVLCTSSTLGCLRAVAAPTAFPGIRYSRSFLCVMSATTPSCGTVWTALILDSERFLECLPAGKIAPFLPLRCTVPVLFPQSFALFPPSMQAPAQFPTTLVSITDISENVHRSYAVPHFLHIF
jgi:hypothetical protein